MRPAAMITMSAAELGDNLARLVWESFTDFMEREPDLRARRATGQKRHDFSAEEVLILFMWVHTRACQQAFGTRVDPALLKHALDAMHLAVFEDLEAQGASRTTLPLFEQRVSTRYSEYYAAVDKGTEPVGDAAARHVSGSTPPPEALVAALAEGTVAAAGPLRDFLEDVALVE